MTKSKMTPEVKRLLYNWNQARIESVEVAAAIQKLTHQQNILQKEMSFIEQKLEDVLIEIEEPIGLKIDGNYIVVVQDGCYFNVNTVDFKDMP